MALQVYNIHHSQLKHLLQGAIFGAMAADQRGLELSFEGLNLLTLVFLVPAVTVTFALPPSGENVYPFKEVKSQIETQAPLLLVTKQMNQLVIARKAPVVGINVALNTTGTANSILGFSTAAVTTGISYATPLGAPPRLISFHQIDDGLLQVITDE